MSIHSSCPVGTKIVSLRESSRVRPVDQVRYAETMSPRTILRGGRVIDVAQGIDGVRDVILSGQTIEDVVIPGGQFDPTDIIKDVSGCLVVPGLIDIHLHCYRYATPLGIEVDKHCLHRGVTTVVDAGSAGATTFAGLRKFIAEKSKTRVLAFLNICMHGLASAGCTGFGLGGELDSLNQVNVAQAVECVEKNRDMIVGIKVRLTADAANDGRNEAEGLRRGLEAASKLNVPVMVHHSMSTVPLGPSGNATGDPTGSASPITCPGSLRPGDIYTHMLHAYKSTIVDTTELTEEGRVAHGNMHFDADVVEAHKRGVLMDIGHGQGSFSWTIAELAAKEGMWPDLISTDLHTGCTEGPAYDLVTVMTKMQHVGMPLKKIIEAVTATPAKAMRLSESHQLVAGAAADITVLRLEDCDMMLEDCQAQLRRVKTRFAPVAVWRDGEEAVILPRSEATYPNKERLPLLSKEWKKLVVRDPTHTILDN